MNVYEMEMQMRQHEAEWKQADLSARYWSTECKQISRLFDRLQAWMSRSRKAELQPNACCCCTG